jgi:hypothetical protein
MTTKSETKQIRRVVLNDIPVLDQDSVFHADDIRRDPRDSL